MKKERNKMVSVMEGSSSKMIESQKIYLEFEEVKNVKISTRIRRTLHVYFTLILILTTVYSLIYLFGTSIFLDTIKPGQQLYYIINGGIIAGILFGIIAWLHIGSVKDEEEAVKKYNARLKEFAKMVWQREQEEPGYIEKNSKKWTNL